MIRFLFTVLAPSLMLTAGCGRPGPAVVGGSEIEQLLATRATLRRAMLGGDAETLEKTYSDDYELVTRKGAVRSRAERIGMIEAGKLRYVRIGAESEVSIETYGNAAVVRGVVGPSETVFDGEKREAPARRFTEIWVFDNGRWQEAGRQATAIVRHDPVSQFVGTWSLERIEGWENSGEWTPLEDRFGAEPAGYLMYDQDGHMSVQIMRKGRPHFSVEDRRKVPPGEAGDALLGYTAYFGTFSVDPEEQSVTHHRIGHIVPNQATIDATRIYHFDGDRLTLALPTGNVRFVWKRLR
jgi:hypothetical protein